MKSSTYLIWLRRLIVLGAVVAGTVASTAGAVGRPPDVQDAAAALHFTSAGLTADGLRLQGIAQVYKQIQSPDVFERYATAHPYGSGISSATQGAFLGSPPDVRDAAATANSQGSDVFERYATAHPYGAGLSEATSSTPVSRPPDVSDAAEAAKFSVSLTQSNGFDWGDYGIGIGSGIGLALILAAGLGMSLQRRHRMQTV